MSLQRVDRRCDFLGHGHGAHSWERMRSIGNPFRRGRVVFFCRGWRP